jgi:DNA primase
LLYGLDLAREAIRRSGDALVMEGYTDVITAHQYGFQNAVAVLGTALGSEHIRILKHYAKRVILVLDGDEAGQKRTKEVLGLFLSQNADLRVLTLPEGLDPCDYLRKYGAAAFADMLQSQSVDALEHAFLSETRGLNVERDVHAATEALERLVAMIAQAPRLRTDTTTDWRLREEKVLQRAAAYFRIDEREVRRRLTALRRKSTGRGPAARLDPAETPQPAAAEKLDPWRRELFELLVAHPECWPTVREQIGDEWLAAGASHTIYQTCCRLVDDGILPGFDRLMLELDNPAGKSLLVELDERWRDKQERNIPPEALLQDLIKTFQYEEDKKRRPAQFVALREGQLDTDQGMAFLLSILEQEGNRQGIVKPKDG